MATYDYRNLSTGEVEEIIFLPGECAPRDRVKNGEVWERMFPAPRIVTQDTRKFRNPPSEAWLKATNKRIVEPGHTKDVERARKYEQDKRDAVLEESVIASVNRAMP